MIMIVLLNFKPDTFNLLHLIFFFYLSLLGRRSECIRTRHMEHQMPQKHYLCAEALMFVSYTVNIVKQLFSMTFPNHELFENIGSFSS